MGVKELWSVLSPVSEKISLWDLKNRTVAVDLSAWVCDSQNVGDTSQRNMYLRNLFFRTSFLLLLDVKPIFVLEGAAPDLKHATIIARSRARIGKEIVKSSNRSHLRSLQKQCEKLLKSMGVPCVQGKGEAESYCAWLNENDIVDAVITQDSDALLYGAKTVYRNFTMSPSYTCEEHDVSIIERKLKLGRNKLLAISLLCGCDYNKGVRGVGKESVLKFLSTLNDDEVLDRLRSWKVDPIYESLEKLNSSVVTPAQKLELNIRKKALLDPDFPSEEIITEYLSSKSAELVPMIGWLQPNLPFFSQIAINKLNWDENYILQKFLPLMTRWHLLHPCITSPMRCMTIVKKRVVKGIKCYECKWAADDLLLEENVTLITVEPQHLIEKCYKQLAEDFIKSTTKKTKKVTRKNKGNENANIALQNITNVESLMHNLSIEETPKKQPTKKRIKNTKKSEINVNKELQTLDKYFDTNKNIETKFLHSLKNDDSKFTLPVSQSTPNKEDFSQEINDYIFNESCHYSPNVSPSPLKHKGRLSVQSDTEERIKVPNKSVEVDDFILISSQTPCKNNNTCTVKNILETTTDDNCFPLEVTANFDKSNHKSLDITEKWSVSDYLPSSSLKAVKDASKIEINNCKTVVKNYNKSMTSSFLGGGNDESEDLDVNLSDLIHSFISKENVNPVVEILLKRKNM